MGGNILKLYYNKAYISREKTAHQSCRKRIRNTRIQRKRTQLIKKCLFLLRKETPKVIIE